MAPLVFTGLSINSSGAECLNSMIKKRIQQATILQRIIKIIKSVNKSQLSKQITLANKSVIQHYDDPGLN